MSVMEQKMDEQIDGALHAQKTEYESIDAGKAKETLNPSESLYGFVAWLSCRDENIAIGSTCNCSIWAEKIAEFCKVNNLPEVREGWTKFLTHPS